MTITNFLWIHLFVLFCLFYSGLAAQLTVEEEPFHKVVFENEYIRLIDGRIPATDTTLMHIHAANSVVVFLSQTTFGIQNMGEHPVITTVHPGDMVYRGYGDKPVNHKVWNQGDAVFHFIVIELKRQYTGDSCSNTFQPVIKRQWTEKSVQAYTLDLQESGYCHLSPCGCACMLICIAGTAATEASQVTKLVPAEGFIFFPAQSDIRIRADKDKVKCVLLQLK